MANKDIPFPSVLEDVITPGQWKRASTQQKQGWLSAWTGVISEQRKAEQIPLQKRSLKLEEGAQLISKGKFAMSAIDWAKPFVIGALILFIFIGGGAGVILNILGAMTWYYWVAAIFIIVMIWRLK